MFNSWVKILNVSLFLGLSSCASKLTIYTEPPQAEVYFYVEGSPDGVKAGETPLEISESKIMELLKISPDSALWIEMSLQKKDFENRRLLLPSNRWGELQRSLKLQLKPMDDPTTTVKKMMNYFFNAKKFAETRQYDLAHAEIDKVLSLDSKMPQALNMKAGIYFLQGEMEEAKALYRKALEVDPGFGEAIQMLERIKSKQGGS